MPSILLLLGAILVSASAWPYMRDITKRQVRPRLVSWAIWTVLLFVLSAVAVAEHQVASAVMSTVSMLGCAAIVVLGYRYGSRRLGRIDIVAAVGAVLGIGAWLLLDNPALALAVAIGVDLLAYVPTLIHAWTEPDEESATAFGMSGVGSILVLGSALADNAGWLGLAYPLYSAVLASVMVALIVSGRLRSESAAEYDSYDS